MESREVFEKIYKRFYQDLIWYGLSLTHNKEEAEDLLSDAFYKLLLNMDKMEESYVKYWLMNVMKHQLLDNLKKKKHQRSYEANEKKQVIVGTEQPEELYDKQEKKQALFHLINQLPVMYKETLVLHYFSDFSISEIASFTNRTNGQVRNILYRGRKQLKERMAEENDKKIR